MFEYNNAFRSGFVVLLSIALCFSVLFVVDEQFFLRSTGDQEYVRISSGVSSPVVISGDADQLPFEEEDKSDEEEDTSPTISAQTPVRLDVKEISVPVESRNPSKKIQEDPVPAKNESASQTVDPCVTWTQVPDCAYRMAEGKLVPGRQESGEGIYLPQLKLTWVWENGNPCGYHPFTFQQMLPYLRDRTVVFVGDSNLRNFGRALVKLADVRRVVPANAVSKHQHWNVSFPVDDSHKLHIYFQWWQYMRISKTFFNSQFTQIAPNFDLVVADANLWDSVFNHNVTDYVNDALGLVEAFCKKWSKQTVPFWMSPVLPVEKYSVHPPERTNGWRKRTKNLWTAIEKAGITAPTGPFRVLDMTKVVESITLNIQEPDPYKKKMFHAVHVHEDIYILLWHFIFNSLEKLSYSV
mmetsp:Transcript_6829/g.10700  ORF Transcript_6829/g.10700 Transcript_6829/m.10700 type:complete len:410 (-) Transcript_6829:178-1407(-)|eukprot:CAMPEP_0184661482 /NCGR_PEP_ID=MMETSP0308-20130426/38604_1 /TAXON_ID=38269 /ORGANISM="Gloeochaete witrockiana, Strain SAG 46.84" /LENGTH=409 /DNA_ID=CAMNT_0027102817 /DNA_START=99 /DNA_END=1328 /DNA_ORIENTATION=-